MVFTPDSPEKRQADFLGGALTTLKQYAPDYVEAGQQALHDLISSWDARVTQQERLQALGNELRGQFAGIVASLDAGVGDHPVAPLAVASKVPPSDRGLA